MASVWLKSAWGLLFFGFLLHIISISAPFRAVAADVNFKFTFGLWSGCVWSKESGCYSYRVLSAALQSSQAMETIGFIFIVAAQVLLGVYIQLNGKVALAILKIAMALVPVGGVLVITGLVVFGVCGPNFFETLYSAETVADLAWAFRVGCVGGVTEVLSVGFLVREFVVTR